MMPVVPAVHYTCGSVMTDLYGHIVSTNNGDSCGYDSFQTHYHCNLYAAREAVHTGLHGGKQLASTSLFEGLIFGVSVKEVVAGYITDTTNIVALEGQAKIVEMMHHAQHAIEQLLVMESQLQMGGSGRKIISDGRVSQEAMTILTHLKSLMWENVGIMYTPAKLVLAISKASAM